MPRASKKLVDPTTWKGINETLVEVLSYFDKDGLRSFFSEFLTKEENVMLSKRLTLYIMLLSNYSDTDIKDTLKISFEIIRSTRNSLEAKSKKFKDSLARWIKKPEKEERTTRFLKMIELGLRAKSDMRARAKLASGDY